MHYSFAIILIGLTAYIIVEYLLINREKIKITVSGYIRVLFIARLVISATFLVIKNFKGYRFSENFIIFMDLTHLRMVVAFLITGLMCIVFKKK